MRVEWGGRRLVSSHTAARRKTDHHRRCEASVRVRHLVRADDIAARVEEEHVHRARAGAAVVVAVRADGEVRDAVAVEVAERRERAAEEIVRAERIDLRKKCDRT